LSLPDDSDAAQPAETSRGGTSRGRAVWIAPLVALGVVAGIVAYATIDAREPHATAAAAVAVELAGGAQSQPQEDAAPDPALVEVTPEGKLPIIAKDGRQPWQFYARPFNPAERRPRVALVISGLGLDGDASRAAIDLPSAVTLGFSPYAHDLPRWIGAARAKGHEVLLGLPMEPTDPARRDPGPGALLTTLDPDKNIARLRAVLGRGAAYVGLVGIMGDRFVNEQASLEPVLEELKARGLLYVDDHAAGATAAAALGRSLGMAWAVTDRALDDDPSAPAVDKALAELETVATQQGAALGLGGLYPVTLDRVRAWVAALDGKTFVLAPASAVATRQAAATAAK
jgi:uncharacterized protein